MSLNPVIRNPAVHGGSIKRLFVILSSVFCLLSSMTAQNANPLQVHDALIAASRPHQGGGSVDPVPDYVSYWITPNTADGTNCVDISTNHFNAYSMNALASTNQQGTANSGYYFDGSYSILVHNNSVFQNCMAGDFTISAWEQTTDHSSQQRQIFMMGPYSGGDTEIPSMYLYYGYGCTIEYFLPGQCDYYARDTSSVWQDGAWHFVTATRVGGTFTLYRDGNQVATGSGSYATSTTGELGIGVRPRYNDLKFLGSIADLRLYQRGISSNEVLSLYNYEKHP